MRRAAAAAAAAAAPRAVAAAAPHTVAAAAAAPRTAAWSVVNVVGHWPSLVIVIVVIDGRCRLSVVVGCRLLSVVGCCRLSSSSVVVVDIVGGRIRWSLLSLLLLSLSPSVVGRSSWSAMVMTAIILLRVMGTAHHRSHMSCELSMLLKKTKSTYLRRRRCHRVVLGG